MENATEGGSATKKRETTGGSNPQEEHFLKARLARANDTTTRNNSKRDALHAFWTILRRKLSHWEERLVTVEETYQKNANNSTNNKQEGLDALERLRFELEQWRKHCMSMQPTSSNVVLASTSSESAPNDNNDDEWVVPEDLSLTDLKQLHSEFTKYSSQWESIRDRLFPKGKFVFRRYREALARRNIRQEDWAKEQLQHEKQHHKDHHPKEKNKKVVQPTTYAAGGAVLENLNHISLVIDKNGMVEVTTPPATPSQENGTINVHDENRSGVTVKNTLPQISSSSLLIRSLQHCTLTIHWKLQGLHLMNLSHVTIFVTQDMSAGAVHVTNCQSVTLAMVECQQLRLHDSTDLTCHIKKPTIVGAILEGCTRITFAVPPSAMPERGNDDDNMTQQKQQSLVDAKDFNWLRTGKPSPNFCVVVQEPPAAPSYDNDDDDNADKPRDDSTSPQSKPIFVTTSCSAPITPTVIATKPPESTTVPSISPPPAGESTKDTVGCGNDDEDDDEL